MARRSQVTTRKATLLNSIGARRWWTEVALG